jgi:alkylhydroperoxidase family enzyme
MADVPLLAAEDATGRVSEVLSEMEAAGRVLPILRAVANADSAFTAFLRYSGSLVQSLELSPRVRELVIMRAASRLHSPYEWGEHYTFAVAAGVTEPELRSLAQGEVPDSLTAHEREIIAMADIILDAGTRQTSERRNLFAQLRARLGEREYTELALVLGWWCGCVPILINVLGLEVDAPDAPVML